MVVKITIESGKTLTTDLLVATVKGMSKRTGGGKSPLYVSQKLKGGNYVIRRETKGGDWKVKVRVRDGDKKNQVKINISGTDEEQMTGSWIEWLFRNFAEKELKFQVDATGLVFTR